MCIVFITYYPEDPHFFDCGNYYKHEYCSFDWYDDMAQPVNSTEGVEVEESEKEKEEEEEEKEEEGCDYDQFSTDATVLNLLRKLDESCDDTGSVCHPNCEGWITSLRLYPCLKGITGIYVESYIAGFGPDYVAIRSMLHSCDVYDNIEDTGDDGPNETGDVVSGNRYDPDTNGLPTGGVCPFKVELGDGETGGSPPRHPVLGMVIILAAASLITNNYPRF